MTRSPPYLIGMMFGLFIDMVESKEFDNLKISFEKNLSIIKRSLLIFWTIIFPIALIVVHKSITFTTRIHFIESIMKLPWSISIGFLILMCHMNHFKKVNELLSRKIWKEISKITFAIYLLSPAIQKTLAYFLTLDFNIPIDVFNDTDFCKKFILQFVRKVIHKLQVL
jgi:peptidoglycan/LPS O-acetylase OafA/YrhL